MNSSCKIASEPGLIIPKSSIQGIKNEPRIIQNKNFRKNQNAEDSLINEARQALLSSVEKIIDILPSNYFGFSQNTQFNKDRQHYCREILKYMLFGYEQLKRQVEMKRILQQQFLIQLRAELLLEATPTIQKCLQQLKLRAIQIQKNIFIMYNTAGGDNYQSKKYQFQIIHFLVNMADFENQTFRRSVLIGSYSPQTIAAMDQIDMLNQNKRHYIQTKNLSVLSYQKKHQQILMRKRKYEKKLQSLSQNKAKDISPGQKKTLLADISHFLSIKYIQKLERQLMEIPIKPIRKKALQNLNQTFSS